MAKKVVTLGEIMLRLSTPYYKRLVQADSFDVIYGGGKLTFLQLFAIMIYKVLSFQKFLTMLLDNLRSIIFAAMV